MSSCLFFFHHAVHGQQNSTGFVLLCVSMPRILFYCAKLLMHCFALVCFPPCMHRLRLHKGNMHQFILLEAWWSQLSLLEVETNILVQKAACLKHAPQNKKLFCFLAHPWGKYQGTNCFHILETSEQFY